MGARTLYGYYRSSAAFRVRVALALKGLDYEYKAVDLKLGAAEHKSPEYLKLNPQGRVPYFIDGEIRIGQSPAILEYLDEAYRHNSLLPDGVADRAWVRQLVNLIACDIHPLNNLSVLQRLKSQLGADAENANIWYGHWIAEGFKAFETMIADDERSSDFCFGDSPSMADIYLVPQIWNARRFAVSLEEFPTLLRIDANCRALEAFDKAMPENQPDAPLE